MWKFTFSWLLIIALNAHGQDAGEIVSGLLDTDTLPKYRVRSVSANFNVMRFGENLLNKPRNSYEVQGELGIHKFFLTGDFGFEETVRQTYSSNGSYWRIGLDANMSAKWEEGNMIGIGLRYARANFSDQAVFSQTLLDGNDDPVLVQQIELSNDNLQARWGELIFKMRGAIHKNLYMGYTMRYQFYMILSPYPEELRPFDVPGYGKTRRPNSFQFDYYVGWRFGK